MVSCLPAIGGPAGLLEEPPQEASPEARAIAPTMATKRCLKREFPLQLRRRYPPRGPSYPRIGLGSCRPRPGAGQARPRNLCPIYARPGARAGKRETQKSRLSGGFEERAQQDSNL